MILEGESVGVNVQTLAFARELGIFDFIAAHPGVSEAEIAAHFGYDVPPLRIALEVLAASGALDCSQDKEYSVTDQTRLYLMENSPLAMLLPPPVMTERVLRMLRRGTAGHSGQKWGRGKADNPEYWAIKQHVISFPIGFALARSGYLEGACSVLDVAGGAGSVVVALASQFSGLSAKILELPGSVKIAQKLVAQYGLTRQIECVGQDMFSPQPWPGQGNLDAVLFTNIFHDWDLVRCQTLADKAYAALKPGGRILIQEALLDEERPGPLWTASFSLSLALSTYGRQYRFSELKPVLKSAGFEQVEARPLMGYYSTVLGVKPR